MDDKDYYHIETRKISRSEFFEVPEEEMRQMINYDLAVNSMRKFSGAKIIKFYDYGDRVDNIRHKVDEPEAMLRVGLARFLRRVLGDIPSYSGGKYRLPIKYQGHKDEFRKEFLEYLEESR